MGTISGTSEDRLSPSSEIRDCAIEPIALSASPSRLLLYLHGL